MLYLQLRKLLSKTYTNSSSIATIAKPWKHWFQWNFLAKRTIWNGRRKVCVNFKTDNTKKLKFVAYRYGNSLYFKDGEIDLELTEYKTFVARRVYLLSYIDIYYERCMVPDETTVNKENKLLSQMDAWFLMTIFPLYPGFLLSFEHNSAGKNLLFYAIFCWGSRLSFNEMDQNFKFGGTIGYGDSYLEKYFVISKYSYYTQYNMMLLD